MDLKVRQHLSGILTTATRPVLVPTLLLGLGSSALPAQDLQQLIADLDAVCLEQGVAAIGFTLVDAEKILWIGARGVTDRASGRAVREDTMFRIGSITKTFIGLALLKAARNDRMSLDTPECSFAPYAP